ncbi:MFS transporter, partial [Pseudonocardia lutea]
DLAGWRAVFAVNVPLGAAVFFTGYRYLPRIIPAGPRPAFDLPGMVLFALSLTSLLVVLMTPQWWPLLAITVAAMVLFVRRELRHGEPFLDLRAAGTNVALSLTFLRTLLVSVAFYAFIYGYPQWVQHTRGLSPAASGLILLPAFLAAIAASAVTGSSPVVRKKLIVAMIVLCAPTPLLLTLGDTGPVWVLVIPCVFMGAGQAIAHLANQTALQHQADPARMGSSAGLLRTFTHLGAVLSATVNAALFAGGAVTSALHGLAWFMGGTVVATLVVVITDRSLARLGRRP